MAKILNVSIDVTKIPKEKLIIGKKGKYINLSIYVNDEKDQFDNDVSVALNQTKEERADQEKKVYIGNGRVVWSGESNRRTQENQSGNDTLDGNAPPVEDDLPF